MAAAAGIGMSLLSQGQQEEAQEEQAEFEAYQARFNQKLANLNAEDAMERGEEAVADYTKKGAQVQGAQKAALAAQGIEIDSGTASQLQYESQKQIDTDVKRIKNNAWRESWGYKVESAELGFSYELAKNKATSSITFGRDVKKRFRKLEDNKG